MPTSLLWPFSGYRNTYARLCRQPLKADSKSNLFNGNYRQVIRMQTSRFSKYSKSLKSLICQTMRASRATFWRKHQNIQFCPTFISILAQKIAIVQFCVIFKFWRENSNIPINITNKKRKMRPFCVIFKHRTNY